MPADGESKAGWTENLGASNQEWRTRGQSWKKKKEEKEVERQKLMKQNCRWTWILQILYHLPLLLGTQIQTAEGWKQEGKIRRPAPADLSMAGQQLGLSQDWRQSREQWRPSIGQLAAVGEGRQRKLSKKTPTNMRDGIRERPALPQRQQRVERGEERQQTQLLLVKDIDTVWWGGRKE
jgi:hypothetical protein